MFIKCVSCKVQLVTPLEKQDGECAYCVKSSIADEAWLAEVKERRLQKEHDDDKRAINDEFDEYLRDIHPEFFKE